MEAFWYPWGAGAVIGLVLMLFFPQRMGPLLAACLCALPIGALHGALVLWGLDRQGVALLSLVLWGLLVWLSKGWMRRVRESWSREYREQLPREQAMRERIQRAAALPAPQAGQENRGLAAAPSEAVKHLDP